MQHNQYQSCPYQSFDNANTVQTNILSGPNNLQLPYFSDTGHINQHTAFCPPLSDYSSLPPSGFMHDVSFDRIQMRPQPPPLQTQNLTQNLNYPPESHYAGYCTSSDSPCTQLSTPITTPTQSSLYMNGSAAESLTSFSPSSNSSAESNSTEENSPLTDYHPLTTSTVDPEDLPVDGAANATKYIERKKRNSRRMWTHSLEKYIFTPHEIATLGTPHRRTIYSASLEAHIDRLHSQLLVYNLFPIHVKDLDMYKGLNCKIAKGMVAGLQQDYVQVRRRLLEIERAMSNAREIAGVRANHAKLTAQSQEQGQNYGVGKTREPPVTVPSVGPRASMVPSSLQLV